MDLQYLKSGLVTFGTRFFTVANSNQEAEITVCPGWNMEDLVSHVGTVYATVEGIISSGSTDRPSDLFSSSPEGDVFHWARNNFNTLLKTLEKREASHPVWTWGKEKNVGFYIRRMAHESLVHMWDAETVENEHISVDGDVACDGIDEYIDVSLQLATSRKGFSYPGGSIHLHRTDGEGEWLLEAVDSELLVKRVHEKGDVAVRGSALSLLLYLWGREPEGLEIFGDPELARIWGSLAP
ncbi:MAG: maleylpyruvate isomerase N-terminal domain-containing protein [Actinomycetota bacterium]|nr:maleylpyruvate isomerase N-terminal domain-containing protein [Actinomycetota bacterium]